MFQAETQAKTFSIESPPRKLFWAVSILSFFAAVSFLIAQTMVGWSRQPVLTSVETYTYPVEDVQFPTITICPSRYNLQKADKVTKVA